MTDERKQRILEVAEELEAQGRVATNSAVYSLVMGHRGHVVRTLKERRAQQAALTGGVAVIEAEDEEPEAVEAETPAATIQEDLQELESSYDAWHLALERLWQIERDGPLSEANYARKQWLEYQMVQNIQAQEQLRPALERARVKEAVLAAVQQHDAGIADARAQAEAALQAIATLKDRLEDVAETFAHQVDRFFPFRDARGMQAFDVEDGKTYAMRLFQTFFPNDPRAKTAFELLVGTPLTIGMLRGALADCQRLQPFSAHAITTYLHQHAPEGVTSNGSHP